MSILLRIIFNNVLTSEYPRIHDSFSKNNNNNNNNNIYTGGVLTLSGFRNGPVKKYFKEVLHNLKKVRYQNSKKLRNAFQFLFKK